MPEEPEAFNAIYKLFQELWRSNQKVNLFSRKLDEKTVFIDHIIDCALALPFFETSQIVLDFGCGGGLPGAVLASCRPLKHFYLFDKSPKKIHYLKQVCDSLDLENCVCFSEADAERFEEADTLTSRAVASTAKIMAWTKQALPNFSGKLLLYKARLESIEQELSEVDKSTCEIVLHALKYPENLKERHLLEITPH